MADPKITIRFEGNAVPSGGTDGQVLTVQDGKHVWKDPPGGDVKTVNGVKPDENGNVVIDTAEAISTDDTIALLAELDALPVLLDADGAILCDGDGAMLIV